MCATLFKIINVFVMILGLTALNAKETQISIPTNIEIEIIPTEATLPFRTIRPSMIELPKNPTKKLLDPVDISKRITPWEGYIQKYAKQYNVDSNLVRAIMYVESRGNPLAISHRGALRLMQIMPATGNFMGISNLMNPDRNIEAGVKYIAWLLYHKQGYDVEHLLWAYNAGLSRVEKGILPYETRDFIMRVRLIKQYLENV